MGVGNVRWCGETQREGPCARTAVAAVISSCPADSRSGFTMEVLMLRRYAMIICVSLALPLAAACGDDESTSVKDGEPSAQACTPGVTLTDCSCATGIAGYRHCGQNERWGACVCPEPLPDGALCREGQRLLCGVCPGESEGRIITCEAGGTFDCSCATDAGTDDAQRPDANQADDAG